MSMIDAPTEEVERRLRLPEDWQTRLSEFMADEKGHGEPKKERRRIRAALERLAELYLWGDIDQSAYKRRRAKLQAELSALVVPEQTAIAEAGRYLEELGTLWGEADLSQRRELLYAILDTVQVDVRVRRARWSTIRLRT